MELVKSSSGRDENVNVTAIAIGKNKYSQLAVKWAIDNLLNHDNSHLILIHVHVHVQSRDINPLDDFDAVSLEGRSPTQSEMQEIFLPHRQICERKGISAKEVVLDDTDVPSAIVAYSVTNSIINIVVGASSRSFFLRKLRHPDVPTSLLKSAPETCTVYVVSKGKVHIERSRHKTTTDDTEHTKQQTLTTLCLKNTPLDRTELSSSEQPDTTESYTTNCEVNETEVNIHLDQKTLESEMKRLRHELKQSMSLCHSVCKEAVAAKEKARELQEWKAEEECKLEAARRSKGAAIALAETEMKKTKAAMEAAMLAQRVAKMEKQKRRYAEKKAKQDEEGRKRAIQRLSQNQIQYIKYSIDELETATNHFVHSQKIGEGGYGLVYRALLNYTTVAIKVLRPDVAYGQRQFHQEVEVLSSMRHPNLVLLLGACPEYGCLVYEYMENGSLEDRLFRNNNTPTIQWQKRFRIAAEIATALLFLHQSKPERLVHRDLKPANILLNTNYVSKIADVGLARLVPSSVADSVTQYHLTAAAGTFHYIDPEYQRTGMLGVKSDLYSFGVLLLQIITAKNPGGLSYKVAEAIKKGSFSEIRDPTVLDWPVEAALSIAELGLKCCELRKKDRPDLDSVILPELNRLREVAMKEDPGFVNDIVKVSS